MNFVKNLALALLILVVFVVVVVGMLIADFVFFDGWWLLLAVVLDVAVGVLAAYIYRWWKYPGLFASHPASFWLGRFLAAVLFFTGGIGVIAVLSKLHVKIAVDGVSEWLGLSFKFRKGKQAQMSSVAAKELRPASLVTVDGFEVVTRDSHRLVPEPPGTVIYKVHYADGEVREVPERELVEVD